MCVGVEYVFCLLLSTSCFFYFFSLIFFLSVTFSALLSTLYSLLFSLLIVNTAAFSHPFTNSTSLSNSIRRYEEYHLRYVKEFSETFFHGNKSQEWFKDRYDPLKMQEQEADNVAWALKESVALKKCLRGILFN